MKFFYFFITLILIPNLSYSKTILEKISPNLSNLWGISVLNDKEILFTQRSGKLYRLNVFNKKIFEIPGVPEVFNYGQGGLLDVEVEEVNNKKIIYLCFSKKTKNSKSATAINSYQFRNNKLLNKKQLFVSNKSSNSSRHFGCRLALNNEYIYATIGDRGERNDSQNLKNHSGTVIKIQKNGNYFNNKAFKNSLPEIFSIGHRNPRTRSQQDICTGSATHTTSTYLVRLIKRTLNTNHLHFSRRELVRIVHFPFSCNDIRQYGESIQIVQPH